MNNEFDKKLNNYANDLKEKYLKKQSKHLRIIMHIDVNSAFLSWTAVFLLKKNTDEIDIRNIPSVIAHNKSSRKSIILAKSYPAKVLGVKTGEPLAFAITKCPDLKIYEPNFKLYEENSKKMVNLLKTYSYYVEKYSIDECFVDVTDFLFGKTPEELAKDIQKDILDTLGFTVNIGIANSKIMAKTASDFTKPNKIHTLYNHEIKEKLWPLEIKNLFMMGKKSREKLNKINIYKVKDLAEANFSDISKLLGKNGESLWFHANGIDNSPVLHEREPIKSISNSKTFSKDLKNEDELMYEIINISLKVIQRMQKENLYCKTITLDLRTYDFINFGKSYSLNNFTNISNEILDVVKNLAKDIYFGFQSNKKIDNFSKVKSKKLNSKILDYSGEIKPIRLAGVKVSNLKLKEDIPNSLFNILNTKEKKDQSKNESLDSVINSLNEKFGNNFVTRARNLKTNTKNNDKKNKDNKKYRK